MNDKLNDFVDNEPIQNEWYMIGIGMFDRDLYGLYIMTSLGEITDLAIVVDNVVAEHTMFFNEYKPTEATLCDTRGLQPFASKFIYDTKILKYRLLMQTNPISIMKTEFPFYEHMCFHTTPIDGKKFIHLKESYFRNNT